MQKQQISIRIPFICKSCVLSFENYFLCTETIIITIIDDK